MTGRGAFSAYIKRLMEKGKGDMKPIRASDIEKLTGKKINHTAMHIILGGDTPWNVEKIDLLSKVFEVDPQSLRDLAAQDWITHTLDNFSASPSKILRRKFLEPEKVPLVQSKDLAKALSAQGYPLTYKRTISVTRHYGPRTFAITMSDDSLKPLAGRGDICIVAPTAKLTGEPYGFFGTKNDGIYIGRLRSDKWYFQASCGGAADYDIKSVEHRNVTFAFSVREVILRGRRLEGRASPGRR